MRNPILSNLYLREDDEERIVYVSGKGGPGGEPDTDGVAPLKMTINSITDV